MQGSNNTIFSGGDSVVFDDSGRNKNINVTSGRTVTDMVISGGNYNFSGGGNITVSNELEIHATGNTTFGSANNISADTVQLASELDTTTTFNGTLAATTLTMSNGKANPEYAGSYVFEGAVTVNDSATVNLGLASTGANHKLLLQANSSFTANTLSLAGAAMKTFKGTVTTSGNLIIAGSNAEGSTTDAHDGATIFSGNVNVGGDFILRDNGSASFGNDSSLNVTGDIYMGDASLTFTRFTQGSVYDFGSIYLTANGAQVNIESLTRVKASISSYGSTAYDFTIGSEPRQFDATLNNINNLNIKGGEVSLLNSTGQLQGALNVSGNASVQLQSNELFATSASGNINVHGGTLNLGTTTQTFNGDITLAHGTITGEEGSSLNAAGDSSLSYLGTGNQIKGSLNLGSYNLIATALPAEDASHVTDTALTLTGSMQGTGTATFTGKGETRIQSALGYTGSVEVQDGTVLTLDNSEALAMASGVTIGNGAGLSISHNGQTTELNGTNGLLLEDGARLNFTNLSGNGGTPALSLGSGKLLFGGDIIISFDEEEEGKKLENLHTYTLVTSAAGIDQKPGTTAGEVIVYANGKDTPLDSSQYEFGYINADGVRYFTFTMLAGKSWKGGASGDWHAMTGNEYDNWTEGAVGEVALFRDQGANIPAVRIELSKQSAAEGMYMDGSTDYTIYTDDTFAASVAEGTKPAAFSTSSDLIKKGNATMAWDNVPLNLRNVDIGEGAVVLTNGSILKSTGTITVSPASYNSSGTAVNTARLTIDSSSTLQQGNATLSGYDGNTAELHGVEVSGGTISGLSSSISGVNISQSISNAQFGIDSAATDYSKTGTNGYSLNNLTLTGTGAIANATLGENVTIDGNYTLGNAVTVTDTVTNTGRITVDAENTIIGIGRMESPNGTYTVFSGGSYTGWSDLSEENFRIHGTLLSDINGVSVNTRTNGSVTLDTGNATIFNWDSAWGIASWDSPTAGYSYSNSGRRTLNVVATSGSSLNSSYRYSSVVNGGSDTTYAVNVTDGAGYSGTRYYLYGIASNASSYTSAETPVDIWIQDEGSRYRTIIAGASSGTYYGDTHLQITGALDNATTIIGASQNATQHGDSYLTIEAGSYSDDTIAAGSSGATHYGNSLLHLKGGTYGTVYGGTYDGATNGGDTRVIVDGGTVNTIYGGDYSTNATTHTGNVTIDLAGGTVTNVYAAGGGNNQNNVSGNAHINLYTNSQGTLATSFGSNAVLDGGIDSITGGGHSALNFADAGTYGLEAVTIQNFSHVELAKGAAETVNFSRFNNTNDLNITGPGRVTITGSGGSKEHDIYLDGGATVKLEVSSYQDVFNQPPSSLPAIHVANGSTVDVTGFPNANTNDLGVSLFLAGDGTDGQGALFKANTEGNTGIASNKVELCEITLTDHASVGAGSEDTGNSAIYMIPLRNTYYAGRLDLQNGTTGRGYIFTKQGSGTFGMFNTDVLGGTLNVAEGTLFTNCSSSGGNTDLVLHEGSTLEFGSTLGFLPGTGEGVDGTASTADHNGFAVESISGAGSVNTGTTGWLYINTDQGYSDFATDFGTKPKDDEQLFYNDKGYEYAVYSGQITGSGQVSKMGSGTQTFTGSESTYTGDTIAEGGILYLTGTSTATDFAKATKGDDGKLKATTTVTQGVVGTGNLCWEGGAVYLADGTRIYNASPSEKNKATIILGVEGGDEINEQDSEGKTKYNEATYSGVLATTGSMTKTGKGTLNFDQFGRFNEGIFIEEGTLNLYGWADADDYNITQNAGSSLMLSYDGSYGEGATETISSTLEVTGTGDERWKSALRTHGRTAALISDIGVAKELEISGKITDDIDAEDGVASPNGNLLHSGEGTLTLSGANDYKGGTIITNGTVIVASDTGLGDTASGGDANLELSANARLAIADGVEMTLAAVKEGTHAGNDIEGTVTIGTGATKGAQLNMTGDGYYATRTEVTENSALVFCGENSTNWKEGDSELTGAGTLAGSGTVVVSDAAGKGTTVCFQVTDSLKESESGFAGDMVVEGDKALLHIQGGQLDGGNYDVSGNGAMIDAQRSVINVEAGKHVKLTSMGDADADAASTAILAAHRVDIASGGTLSVANAATSYQYNVANLEQATQFSMEAALTGYSTTQSDTFHYHSDYAQDESTIEVTLYNWHYDKMSAVNVQTSATLQTDGGVSMAAGSIYEFAGTNTSLTGTPLTFNISEQDKIILSGGEAFDEYLTSLVDAGSSDAVEDATSQWVLFSDVGQFDVLMGSKTLVSGTALAQSGLENQIHVALARDVFNTQSGTEIPDNIMLVYDAGAQVVYLDRVPNYYPPDPETPIPPGPSTNVPEPGTATLSLLALSALMTRRRRK